MGLPGTPVDVWRGHEVMTGTRGVSEIALPLAHHPQAGGLGANSSETPPAGWWQLLAAGGSRSNNNHSPAQGLPQGGGNTLVMDGEGGLLAGWRGCPLGVQLSE